MQIRDDKMTISFKCEEKEISLRISIDVDGSEILEELLNLMIAWGYHPHTVRDVICEKADCYRLDEEEEEKNDKDEKL